MINREDMLALTRRMTVKRTSMTRIAGGYLDRDGYIDGTFNTGFLKLSPDEKEKNLQIAKVIPFADTNQNLKEYAFSSEKMKGDSMWKLLMGMRVCGLKNDALMETFYDHLCDDNRYMDPDPHHFAEVLLNAYKNGDVSALLLELCNRSMFDLLKESYLIPRRFHGKCGENPVLLTDVDGDLLEEEKAVVSKHEYKKFREIYQMHKAAPRSKLYLADGYNLVRYYTSGMNICEKQENKERGILILYALPDTKKLNLTEAQAYDIIWSVFHKIQKEAFSAVVYYGQETGSKPGKSFDELGVLLPIHQFESKMLQHLEVIDGLVLACREEMIKMAGTDSFDL